ncbi:MAG TPA: hypothetical protein VLE27_12915, partial [Thermoanaerobaculia bacterium]|nr:hypothetical protein [Thermoanaerobaculia bacterium]
VTQVDLQAFGGARAVYKLLYNDSTDDQSTTGSPVGLTGCRGVDNYSIWFLTRLVLPDGSTYEMPKAGYFSYNVPGDFTNPCKTGLISRLRLPTRGLIEWDYTLYQFPSTSSRWLVRQKATGVGRRSILNAASASIGDWTYGTSLSGGTTGRETLLTNSVTDPLGNRVTRYFSVCVNNCAHPDGPYEYGLPVGRDAGGDGTGRILSAQVLQGGATPLRTTYARFEHDPAGPSTLVEDRSRLNQRLASQRTVFNDDSAGTYADEDFSNFDGLGHYRTRVTGGNFPGNNARIGFVNFNPTVGTYGQAGYAPWPAGSPWVLNTYSFAYDQENGKIQYRIACFEPGTGFLLRHRVLKNSGSAESANDLLQVFQRNANGNLVTESHYGGDTQSLSFNACGMALPASPTYQYTHLYTGGVRSRTSVTLGTVLRTLDLTIDTSTGLPNASRDTAGKQTNFSYDTLGRLTLIDPTDDVATTYDYCTATSTPFICPSGVRAQIVITRNNGIDVTAVRQRFDDWGRMINEAERMPPAGNYIDRSINYNALGWQTYVSERSSGSGTSFLSYDAFGRPLTVRPPDGGAHDVFISYQGVRQVSRTAKVATSTTAETSATTTEVYDRFGRLYEVTEPNGTRTRYEYDVGNRLSKVCQNATGTGTATCGQQRLFTYDHRGFLLSERHPEKGASGNGTVSYFNYDARGHATRKVDGPNDLTFSYDKAERLTQVRETGSGFTGCSMTTVAAGVPRCLKELFYSGGNAGASYSKGKLMEARRYNYPTIGTSPFTVVVSDLYTYAGR